MLLTADDLRKWGREWAEFFNRRAIDEVLAHYADDVEFYSPFAVQYHHGSPRVRGRTELSEYWRAGLDRVGKLHFDVDTVFVDEPGQALVVDYRAQIGERLFFCCEKQVLENGLVVRSVAHYCEITDASD